MAASPPLDPHDDAVPHDDDAGPAARGTVLSVNTGAERENPFPRPPTTGIRKTPAAGPVEVADPGPRAEAQGSLSGLAGDFVGDRVHHGGTFQAVYAFRRDELDHWERELGRELAAGEFGENLTITGLDVDAAVIGEIWQVGTARLRVTEPRIPCGTFAAAMQEQGWIRRFTERARSGAYLAVGRPGRISAGDDVLVLSRPAHGVTVAEAFRARTLERGLAARVLEADADLSPKLRDRIEALLRGEAPSIPQ